MPDKLRVGVVFGGRSGEHEVSLRSAKYILESLDPAKYDVRPIGITKAGGWLLEDDPMRLLEDGAPAGQPPAHVPVSLPVAAAPSTHAPAGPFDVVFPVMHGTHGEDGAIQGLFELADTAYVGSGVAGSAVGMDKALQKRVLHAHGLPVAETLVFTRSGWAQRPERVRAQVAVQLGYPAFVKPCNLGSSVGISKVHDPEGLDAAIDLAAAYDRRIVAEAAVPNAREIEVGVIGNDDPQITVCGEIIPGGEFYDYADKYVNGTARAVIPADIPVQVAALIRHMARQAYQAIDAAGFARVDFLLDGETMDVKVNEVNTIPGFTSISLFPQLWKASGVDIRALLDRLIELALERHAERRATKTSYT